jgi:hypothetical protein
VLGVLFAGLQFFWSQKAARRVETGTLLHEWHDTDPDVDINLWDARYRMDKDVALEPNRTPAFALYARNPIQRGARTRQTR